MLRFEKAISFKRLVDSLYTDPTAVLTAQACVLLEQPAAQITKATTIEPSAIYQRLLVHTETYSGGTAGTTLLIDQTELKQKLDRLYKAGINSLTLKVSRGNLNLIADYAVLSSGEKESGRLVVRQYAGPTTDFVIKFEPNHKVCNLRGQDFNHWVKLLQKFGQFAEKADSTDAKNRLVLIDINNGTFTGSTSHKGAYTCYLTFKLASTVIDAKTSGKYTFEGRHLKKLLNLCSEPDEEITVYLDQLDKQTWVSFCTKTARISLLLTAPGSKFLQTYALNDLTKTKDECARTVHLDAITKAVGLQLPEAGSLQQDILLVEKVPSLVILPGNNLKGTELSYIDVIPEANQTAWTATLVNGPPLHEMLTAIRLFISLRNLDVLQIRLNLRSIQRKSSKGWLLFIETFDPALKVFILMKEASSVPNLDSDE